MFVKIKILVVVFGCMIIIVEEIIIKRVLKILVKDLIHREIYSSEIQIEMMIPARGPQAVCFL